MSDIISTRTDEPVKDYSDEEPAQPALPADVLVETLHPETKRLLRLYWGDNWEQAI